jgi:hypothetical protein
MASGLIPLRYARVARDDYKIKFSLRLRGKIISESEREREREREEINSVTATDAYTRPAEGKARRGL